MDIKTDSLERRIGGFSLFIPRRFPSRLIKATTNGLPGLGESELQGGLLRGGGKKKEPPPLSSAFLVGNGPRVLGGRV